MSDFIVDPPSNECPEETPGLGASLTSQITYDSSNLSCIGVTANTNLNTVLSSINSAVCAWGVAIGTNTLAINTYQTQIANISSTVNNLDCTQIADRNTANAAYTCITGGINICATLLELEALVCSVQVLTEGQLKCLQWTDRYRRQTTKRFIAKRGEVEWGDYSAISAYQIQLEEAKAKSLSRCLTRIQTETKLLEATKDNYVYADTLNEVYLIKPVVIGDPAPATADEEVLMYKITTDNVGITASVDLREFQPYDESFFEPGTDLSGFLPTGSLSTASLDLSTKMTYTAAHTMTADEDIVHKKYVDDTVAAATPTGVWSSNGTDSYFDTGVVGIGTNSPDPAVALHIGNTFKYTDGSEAVGRLLQSDADGIATWVDFNRTISVQDEGSTLGDFTAINFVGSGVTAVSGGGTVTVTVTGSVSTFNDLSNVSVAGALTTHTLRYNGVNWISSDNLLNDGTYIGIGESITLDSLLHIKDGSGNDLLHIEGTGGNYMTINSAGVGTYLQQLIYSFTNAAANPLGANFILADLDGTGKLVWVDPTTLAGLSDLQAVTAIGNTTTNDILLQAATTPSLYYDNTTYSLELTAPTITSNRIVTLPDFTMTLVGSASGLSTGKMTRVTDTQIIASASVDDDGVTTSFGEVVNGTRRVNIISSLANSLYVVNTATTGTTKVITAYYNGVNASDVYGIFSDVANSGAGMAWAGYFKDGEVHIGGNLVVGTPTLNASAVAEFYSDTKGVAFPRVSTTNKNAIVNPLKSLTLFDTDLNDFQVNIGTPGVPNWVSLVAAGGGMLSFDITDGITPQTITNGNTLTFSGTTNRLDAVVSATDTVTFDISASYVGQASITTLGTIISGTWNGSTIDDAYLTTSYLPLAGGTMTGNIDFTGTDAIGIDFGFGGTTTSLRHESGKSFVVTSNGNRIVFGDGALAIYDGTTVTNDSFSLIPSLGLLRYVGYSTIPNGTLDLKLNLVSTDRTWSLPDADGIVALESYVTTVVGNYLPLAGGFMTGDIGLGTNSITGSPTDGRFSLVQEGIRVSNPAIPTYGIELKSTTSPYILFDKNGVTGSLIQNVTLNRTWTLPDATGIVALTSDLNSYLPLAGGTMTGDITLGANSLINGSADFSLQGSGFTYTNGTDNFLFDVTNNDIEIQDGGTGFIQKLVLAVGGQSNTWTMPDATGTVALTSDLGSYLPLAGGTMVGNINIDFNSGYKIVGANIRLDAVDLITLESNNINIDIADSVMTLSAQTAVHPEIYFDYFGGSIRTIFRPTSTVARTIELPDASGTLALTSDIPSLANYALVGTYTNGYVPRWNATTNTLESGIIQDNGSTLGIGGAPSGGIAKVLLYGGNIASGLYVSHQYTGASQSQAVYGLNNQVDTASFKYGVFGKTSGNPNINIGVGGETIVATAGINIGGKFEASNATTANYSLQLVDGTQTTANRVLSNVTTDGYANWVDLTVGLISATGTPSASTYLRGDGTWATIAAGGGMVTGISLNDGANINAANRSVLNFIDTSTAMNLTIADDAGGDEVDITIDIATGGITYDKIDTKSEVALSDADQTLGASDMVNNGILYITPTTTRTLTTDTAVNIIAQIPNYQVGTWFDFTIIDLNVSNDVTLAAGAGVTLVGHMTVRASSGTFRCRIDSASTVTIYALTKHDIQSLEITSGMIASNAITSGKIDTAAVTFAKIQDASGASLLLGRGSAAGAGDFEEIILGTNLSMSGTTLNATGGSGDVATDTIWDAAGDLAVGTGSDTAAKLAIGTGYQHLRANSGATALEYVTVEGHVECPLGTAITSGALTSGFAIISNQLEFQTDGLNGANTENIYFQFVVPNDYKSGGEMWIHNWRSGVNDAYQMSVYINGTVDTTINALDINPVANVTWETKTSSFGSTLTPGDIMTVKIFVDADTAEDVSMKGLKFKYNK